MFILNGYRTRIFKLRQKIYDRVLQTAYFFCFFFFFEEIRGDITPYQPSGQLSCQIFYKFSLQLYFLL